MSDDEIPEGYVPIFGDELDDLPISDDRVYEQFEKWAGQPSDGGGLAGQTTPPKDAKYDPQRKPNPYAEVGASGLAQYGGFVRDEFLPQLQGDRGLKTFREMYDNDSIVGSLVFAIQMLIRKVECRVEPPEGASVEDIVEERIAERQRLAAERKQAQQQKLMMAQAGLAQNVQGGKAGGPAAAGSPPPKPQSPRAAGVLNQGPARFQGIDPQKDDEGLPGGGIRKWFRKAIPAPQAGPPVEDPKLNKPGDPAAQPQLDPTGMSVDPELIDIAPESRKAEELAVFVETCLHDMADSWPDILSQIITMIVYGFAIHEIIYKKRKGPNVDEPDKGSRFDDGKVGWAKLAGRAQETRHRWEFSENGDVVGFWQLAPPKFQIRYIPLSKALLFRTTAYKGNPEGRSVLRSAYRSWFFKRRIEEYEAIGVERNLAGLPVAYVPYEWMTPFATPEQKQALEEVKKVVRNLRRGEQDGVVFPRAYDENGNAMYDLVLLNAGGGTSSRVMDTDKIISRYEQRILMVALADFILLGHEAVGAKSLGDTKSEIFTAAMQAFLDAIADVFNTYAIPRLMKINGEDPALSPKLVFGKVEPMALSEITELVTALSQAGADMFPDTQLEDSLRERAGLPPKAASDDL